MEPVHTGDSEAIFKEKHRCLKRKLKYLIYENECFSVEIRNMEKKLLRILKDRTFLLDLLMQHETTAPEFESTDEDVTDSSDQEEVKPSRAKIAEKKKKIKMAAVAAAAAAKKTTKPRRKPAAKAKDGAEAKTQAASAASVAASVAAVAVASTPPSAASTLTATTPTVVAMASGAPAPATSMVSSSMASMSVAASAALELQQSEDSLQGSKHLAGHMTPEEVERHLESRRAQQSQLEFTFAPDKAPATVPTEMFSNDVEGGDFMEFLEEMETSPSNGGDEHAGVDSELV